MTTLGFCFDSNVNSFGLSGFVFVEASDFIALLALRNCGNGTPNYRRFALSLFIGSSGT